MKSGPEQKSDAVKPRHPGDSACRTIEEDELERAPFSERLARTIALTPTADEARIIALYGDWGCGKTSVKNFISHYLRTAHGIEPIEFAPYFTQM